MYAKLVDHETILYNEYLLAKIGLDTAESARSEVFESKGLLNASVRGHR